MSGIKLGESNFYTDSYDKSLLEPISRGLSRADLGSLKFTGWDIWNAYELSWLAPSGVPQLAIAQFCISAQSENIIESKSFKYYLNSFNQTVFASRDEVLSCLKEDLSGVAKGVVDVSLISLEEQFSTIEKIPGRCIDHIPCEISVYQPSKDLLSVEPGVEVENEELFSHVLKSNCPVTGQPDWASVWLRYSGNKICEVSLLKYLVAFRQYQGFHESCVERVFNDVLEVCQVTELSVFARYTRRGGLDINPFRTTSVLEFGSMPFGRTNRQ